MNWPDKEGAAGAVATPEVAAGLPVISRDGKTYTFTIKPGFRFSNGKPVTAKSFVDAFNRFANPRMQSTGVQFLDIVKGAQAVIDGKARTISGVRANGNKFVVQLTKASPDFLARLTMPFIQAIDPTLAGQIDANGINQYASCGPYYFSARTPGRSITLKRNPYYKGGRAANADTIQVNVGNDIAVAVPERREGDVGLRLEAASRRPSGRTSSTKYGLNKKDGRVQVRPLLDVRYVAMNHSRPLFKDNPGLAKAVNWTVDRQAFSAQGGYLYGKRTGQILPPGMLGYKPQGIYPLRVTGEHDQQAKKLAEGNLRGGKAVLWSSNTGIAPLQAQLIQYNLRQIGLDAEIRLLPRAQQFTNAGNPQTADLRPDDRAVGRGLRRPVRLHQHPARRGAGHEPAAQQLRVLQRREVQPPDDGGVAADRRQARHGVRGTRRRADAREPAVGAARQLERPDLPVVARRLHHDQRGPRQRSAPQRDLPQVADRPDREGRRAAAPPRSRRGHDDVPVPRHDDFSGPACSSSA